MSDMGARSDRHRTVSEGSPARESAAGPLAPANGPAALPAPSVPGAWRPEPWREPNSTILTRLAASHRQWRIEPYGTRGWKATRRDEASRSDIVIRGKNLTDLEIKLDALPAVTR